MIDHRITLFILIIPNIIAEKSSTGWTTKALVKNYNIRVRAYTSICMFNPHQHFRVALRAPVPLSLCPHQELYI